jgi:hypothetical protein
MARYGPLVGSRTNRREARAGSGESSPGAVANGRLHLQSLRSHSSCHPLAHPTTATDTHRHVNTHYHRTLPDCLPELIAPGQYLAASIGSTDPRIARLPFQGLATRDKAEGAPPSGSQTALGTSIQHTPIAITREPLRPIEQTSHKSSCTTRIAAWARLGKHRQAIVLVSSSSRCAPSSRPRPADQMSTSINVSILRTILVRSSGGLEQRTRAYIAETYPSRSAWTIVPCYHPTAIALDIILTYLRA